MPSSVAPYTVERRALSEAARSALEVRDVGDCCHQKTEPPLQWLSLDNAGAAAILPILSFENIQLTSHFRMESVLDRALNGMARDYPVGFGVIKNFGMKCGIGHGPPVARDELAAVPRSTPAHDLSPYARRAHRHGLLRATRRRDRAAYGSAAGVR